MKIKVNKLVVVFVLTLVCALPAIAQRKGARAVAPVKERPSLAAPVAKAGVPPQDANVDMDGDNRTDFVVLREGGAALTKAQIEERENMTRAGLRRERLEKARRGESRMGIVDTVEWWTRLNTTGATAGAVWGNFDFDWFVSGDFDGDSRDDLIYWRPNDDPAQSGFYWINSATSTFGFDAFGTYLDDPTVVGDYDDDGIDDRAVFRCSIDTPGPCYYYFRRSSEPSNTSFNASPWGYGVLDDFFPCPGDYDGDGAHDLCVQRVDPNNPNYAQYVLRRSSDGGAEYVSWGAVDDFMVPGDYDGDGRTDFGARRTENGVYYHYILERDGGGTGAGGIPWGGNNGTGVPDDRSAPGDYDGDGRMDIAIWNPVTGVFWVRHANGTTRAETWGSLGDSVLAEWIVR